MTTPKPIGPTLTDKGRVLLRAIGRAEAVGQPIADILVDRRVLVGLGDLVAFDPRQRPDGSPAIAQSVVLTDEGRAVLDEMEAGQ